MAMVDPPKRRRRRVPGTSPSGFLPLFRAVQGYYYLVCSLPYIHDSVRMRSGGYPEPASPNWQPHRRMESLRAVRILISPISSYIHGLGSGSRLGTLRSLTRAEQFVRS